MLVHCFLMFATFILWMCTILSAAPLLSGQSARTWTLTVNTWAFSLNKWWDWRKIVSAWIWPLTVCVTGSYLQETGDVLFFQTLLHQGLLHVPAWSRRSSSKTSSFSPVQLLLLAGHSAVAGRLRLSTHTHTEHKVGLFFRVYKVLL